MISLLCLLILPVKADAFGWGYKKSNGDQPPDVGMYGPLIQKYDGFYVDPSGDKEVYLTFDNGYEEGYTASVLDVLKEKKVPATFFITGHYIKSAEDLVKRMVDEGHIVGNHSWHHPDFTEVSRQKMKEELDRVEQAVADLTDQEEMLYMRPPRGTFNANTLEWTREMGYIHAFWSIAFVDWNTNQQKGWQYAYRSVMDQVHPGAVILLHTVSKDNAEALERMIDGMRKEGYEFKSLDHLMMKRMLPKGIYQF
ncbi:delta-lactam-biosynthetic de-N-acetylase [Thalassobacillus hwangdonensis]|uniref:Delta-lactam-biosynthetic de-N-acetylase n=1 Tax=Thalassobacillus hwangdonensis TaxID=546108 RepID=A0ABW3L7N3_9BACI